MRCAAYLLFASLTAAGACAPLDSRNGSAVCLSLAVVKGQLSVASAEFAPSGAYTASAGAAFIAMAKGEIAKLPKPCVPLFAKRAVAKPNSNPLPTFCTADAAWPAFRDAVVAINPDFLSETVFFRPLMTAYYHSPLLWSDNNASLDAENGVVTFFVADPMDPRTDPFQIQIQGAADDATRDRRIARLRQFLSPLRGRVFCHDRIRALVREFYKREKINYQILQLEPQGPLLIIQEKP